MSYYERGPNKASFRYGKKRPGQWTDATRDKRRRRADRAWWRRYHLAHGVCFLKQDNRATRRQAKRAHIERLATQFGVAPKAGEFTADLAMRVQRAFTLPRPGITHEDIRAMGACAVEHDVTAATVRVTMPADTSAQRCCDVLDEIAERLPAHVALMVEAG